MNELKTTLARIKTQTDTPIIFSDGACSGNPGRGGWGSVLVHQGQVREMGRHDESTTNNRMEMMAVLAPIESLLTTPSRGKLKIHVLSDSTYVIKGASQWLAGWQRRGWKTADGAPVKNQDLWERFASLQKAVSIDWHYVPGHSGVAGNERCDEIAVAMTHHRALSLYEGSLANYPIALFDLDVSQTYPVYLASVDRELVTFGTWPACEAAVKGRPGAKFKKVKSRSEWQECLRQWGFPEDTQATRK